MSYLADEIGEPRLPDEIAERWRLECEVVSQRWRDDPATIQAANDPEAMELARIRLDKLLDDKINQMGAWFKMLLKVSGEAIK